MRRLDDLDEAGAWIADWPGRWAEEKGVSWAIVDDQVGLIAGVGLGAVIASGALFLVSRRRRQTV